MTTSTTHAREAAQEQLKVLHDTYGFTWQEIAQIYPFLGMKTGTLSSIANGVRKVPGKYVSRFRRYQSLFDIPTSTLRLMLENRS